MSAAQIDCPLCGVFMKRARVNDDDIQAYDCDLCDSRLLVDNLNSWAMQKLAEKTPKKGVNDQSTRNRRPR